MATTVANLHRDEPFDILVARPSKWGNPFKLEGSSRNSVLLNYGKWLLGQPDLLAKIPTELRDKRLGCFCAPLPCHASILALVADHGVETLRARIAWAEGLYRSGV